MIVVEHREILVIHCNVSGCKSRYYGTHGMSRGAAEEAASEAGWQINIQTHFCSECVRKEELTVELKRTVHELEKRERRHLLAIDRLRRGQFTEAELQELATNLPPDDLALALVGKRVEVIKREKDGGG